MIHSSLGHGLLAGSLSDLTNPVDRNSEQTIHRDTENIRLVAQQLCYVTHTDPTPETDVNKQSDEVSPRQLHFCSALKS